MKKILVTTLLIASISTQASAGWFWQDKDKEHNASDCASRAAIHTAGGAAVLATTGVAATWAFGVILAPFTFGGSLVAAAATTVPAGIVGAKAGAIYGASAGATACVLNELND